MKRIGLKWHRSNYFHFLFGGAINLTCWVLLLCCYGTTNVWYRQCSLGSHAYPAGHLSSSFIPKWWCRNKWDAGTTLWLFLCFLCPICVCFWGGGVHEDIVCQRVDLIQKLFVAVNLQIPHFFVLRQSLGLSSHLSMDLNYPLSIAWCFLFFSVELSLLSCFFVAFYSDGLHSSNHGAYVACILALIFITLSEVHLMAWITIYFFNFIY